ncbi:MAG TPA: CoA transferase [Kofleriaceae bacterium]|nr:CoA transferase [Kofleriaceae bacterium]
MPPVLHGVRIVEQGTFITGPCTGMMLADLGADVIKVESPAGDPYRSYQGGQFSPHFQAYNRNKRSIALDLNDAADLAVFERLVGGADVYIQNFRPGTAERLGAGTARLHELNPRLVYCSITGFGSSGPYVDRPSYDSVAQALSGFLSVVVDPDQPRFMGPALADAITGIYAAYGVLGALVERGRTGVGRLVEISMLEAMSHFAIEPFAAFFALGQVPRSSDRPRLAQAYILRTGDGGLIAIHLSSLEKFWLGLTRALGAPELARDDRFATRQARIDNYEALGAALDARFAGRPTAHWVERLGENDVPFAPIHRIDQVLSDPQVRHLDLIVPVDSAHGGARAVRPAVQFDRQRAAAVRTAPLLDEHGAAIRQAVAASGPGWPELDETEVRGSTPSMEAPS